MNSTNTTQLAVPTSERRTRKLARLPHSICNRMNTITRCAEIPADEEQNRRLNRCIKVDNAG